MTTLTLVLREFYVCVPEGVTREQLLKMKNVITLTPADPEVRLVFKKRK